MPRRRFGDLARRARRGWLVALVMFAVVAGGLVAGAMVLPPDFRSSAALMVTSRDTGLAQTTPAGVATRSALVDESVETLNSPAMAERIVAELKRKAPTELAIIEMRNGGKKSGNQVRAHRRGESYVVDVEASAPTPQSAKAIVEAAIEVFQVGQLDQRFATVAAAQPSPVAAAPAGPAAELARLEEQKVRLLATKTASGTVPLASADPVETAALAEARKDIVSLKTLQRSEVGSADIAAFRASGALDRLGDSGSGLASDLSSAEAATDPAKPDEAKFRKYRILTVISQLLPTMEQRVSRLAVSAAAAPAPAASPEPSAETASRLKLLDLQIEAQKKLAAASPVSPGGANSSTVEIDVRVVARPSPGVIAAWRQPVFLYPAAIGIALLAAIACLAGAIFASNTILDPYDAAALAGAPLLATIPRITAAQLRGLAPNDRHPANFAIENPASSFADGMRTVLAAIRATAGRTGPVCIAVAGVQSGDGASTVSLALARTAAAGGLRVLLIDSDFDAAGLTRAMNIEPAAGIEAIVGGGGQMMDLVVEDDMTSVHLLPSAPSAAIRGALSLTQLTALKAALAGAKSVYEMIIIDCQPLGTRTRAGSMYRMADVAVVIAAWDVTKRAILRAIARRMGHGGATVGGVVFNFSPERVRSESVAFAAEGRPAAPVARAGVAPFAPASVEAPETVRIIH